MPLTMTQTAPVLLHSTQGPSQTSEDDTVATPAFAPGLWTALPHVFLSPLKRATRSCHFCEVFPDFLPSQPTQLLALYAMAFLFVRQFRSPALS